MPPSYTLVSCLTYSSTLKMVISSSETSIGVQRTTRRYMPEDRTLVAMRTPDPTNTLILLTYNIQYYTFCFKGIISLGLCVLYRLCKQKCFASPRVTITLRLHSKVWRVWDYCFGRRVEHGQANK